MSLRADGVSVQRNGRGLLAEVGLSVGAGKVHALLGPNGAGKTTLLRVLAGEWTASGGSVQLDGLPLSTLPATALARRRAVFGQVDTLRFALRVEEVVALGRLPHAPESAQKEARIVAAALAMSDATQLVGRSYPALSAGERTRVRLARALAQVWEQFEQADPQAPRYLLLDEPAAHLDPAHQHFTLQCLRRFAKAGGGVLVTLHDLNLALAYADRASLLAAGRIVAAGPVDAVLVPEQLQPLYGIGVQRLVTAEGQPLLAWSTGSHPQ